MLQSLKSKLGFGKPAPTHTIQVSLSAIQITQIINSHALDIYPIGHGFIGNYLQKIIIKKNSDLQKRLGGFVARLN